MTEPTTTYGQAHSVNCWRWHHQCGVNRINQLTAVLAEILGTFDEAAQGGGGEYLRSGWQPVKTVDGWHRALELAGTAVAGADVTPDPAAPATTT